VPPVGGAGKAKKSTPHPKVVKFGKVRTPSGGTAFSLDNINDPFIPPISTRDPDSYSAGSVYGLEKSTLWITKENKEAAQKAIAANTAAVKGQTWPSYAARQTALINNGLTIPEGDYTAADKAAIIKLANLNLALTMLGFRPEERDTLVTAVQDSSDDTLFDGLLMAYTLRISPSSGNPATNAAKEAEIARLIAEAKTAVGIPTV